MAADKRIDLVTIERDTAIAHHLATFEPQPGRMGTAPPVERRKQAETQQLRHVRIAADVFVGHGRREQGGVIDHRGLRRKNTFGRDAEQL